MSYGVIVSLPGYDATNCLPEQTVFHSDFPSPKVEERNWAQPADYVFPGNPGPGSGTVLYIIPHGFSYIPAAFVFLTDVNGFSYASGTSMVTPYNCSAPQNIGAQYFDSYTDATNLYIRYIVQPDPGAPLPNVYKNITGYGFRFKYYIFTENGA